MGFTLSAVGLTIMGISSISPFLLPTAITSCPYFFNLLTRKELLMLYQFNFYKNFIKLLKLLSVTIRLNRNIIIANCSLNK